MRSKQRPRSLKTAGRGAARRGEATRATEQKKVEKALRESEERFRGFADRSLDPIIAIDSNGRFTFVSSTVKRIAGYRPEELIGVQFQNFVAESEIPRVVRAFRSLMSGENVEGLQVEVKGKDGSRVQVEVNGSPIRRNERVIGLQGIVRDITERKKAEDALRESEAKFRSLVERTAAAVGLCDLTGQLTYVNKAFADLMGYSIHEMLNQPFVRFLHPDDVEKVMQEFVKGLTTKEESSQLEFRAQRKDGGVRYLTTKPTRLAIGDRTVGFEAIVTDITEHKMAEEVLKEQHSTFEGIINSSDAPIFSVDRHYRYTSFNAAHASVMKAIYGRDIAIGQSLLDHMTVAEDREKAKRNLDRALAGEQFVEEAYSGEEARSRRFFEVSHNPISSKSRAVIGVAVFAQDATERKQTDERLHQSVERYYSLFDRILDGIYRSTHEGRFVDVNSAFVKMFGYSSKQEVLDIKDIAKELYFSPKERGSHILDTGREEIEAYRMRRKDGSEIWVEDHGRYVHDDKGNIIYHEGILRDITERKRADETLRESQSRYKALFEDSPMPLWLQDQSEVKKSLDDLKKSGITDFEAYFQSHPEVVRELLNKVKILDVNQATSRLYEAPNKEAYKEGLARLFTEEGLDSFRRQLVRMAEGSTQFQSEYTALTFPGDKRRISLTLSVAPGYEESLSRVFVSTIDITERKQMEDELKRYSTQLEQLIAERTGALQESEKKYRQLIETAQEGLFTYDTNGIVTFVNAFISTMLRYPSEEIVGKNLLAFVDEEDVSRVKAGMQRRRLGIAETYEVRLIRNDGSRIHVSATVSPITDEDGVFAGGLTLLSDITERKKLEAQLAESQRLATIGETTTMVGHDLRNPLQAMANALYLVKRLAMSEKVEDRKEAVGLLSALDNEIQYMDKIVSDLQDYARPLEPDMVQTNLVDLVRATVSSVMIPRNVEVVVDIRDVSSLMLDPALFRRVLTNLILNAVQAMPEGGKLAIAGSRVDKSFTVSVQDTGVGIAPEDLGKIFSPFFTTKAKGQGLGLAVCERLMDAQGGTIDVVSQVGRGSTFTLRIPTNKTPVVS